MTEAAALWFLDLGLAYAAALVIGTPFWILLTVRGWIRERRRLAARARWAERIK